MDQKDLSKMIEHNRAQTLLQKTRRDYLGGTAEIMEKVAQNTIEVRKKKKHEQIQRLGWCVFSSLMVNANGDPFFYSLRVSSPLHLMRSC